MKMNCSDDTSNSPLSKELRGLILRYVEACNKGEFSLAEGIMKQIEQHRGPNVD